MKHLALLLLLGCATSHEAHSEAKIEAADQEEVRLETHTEEGAWSVRTWQFAPKMDSSHAQPLATEARPVAHDAASTQGHPSFLGWPTDGEVISYSEEVHQPTKIDATKDATKTASLKAKEGSWWRWDFKVGLSLVTKLGIALGLALALWMARKRIRALLPF